MVDIKDLSREEQVELYQQLQKEFATKRIDKKLDEVNKKKTEYQKLKNKLKDKFGYDLWSEKLLDFSFLDNEFKVETDKHLFSDIETFDRYNILLFDIKYQKEIEKMVKDFKKYVDEKNKIMKEIFSEVREKKQELLNTLKYKSEKE